MSRSLVMAFLNEQGKKTNVTVNNVKDGLTGGVVNAAMDAVIQKNIFNSKGGDLLSKDCAYVVDRQRTDIEL